METHRGEGDERKEPKKRIKNALCGRRYPHYAEGPKSLKTNHSAFDVDDHLNVSLILFYIVRNKTGVYDSWLCNAVSNFLYSVCYAQMF